MGWIHAALVIAVGSALAPASAQVGPARSILVDATGKTIGYFHPGGFRGNGINSDLASTVLKMGRHVFQVSLRAKVVDGTLVDFEKVVPGSSGATVFFGGPACSGAAYLQRVGQFTIGGSLAVTIGDGTGSGTVYVGVTGPFALTSVASERRADGQCYESAGATEAAPVALVVNLSDHFVAPYSVR